MAYTQDYMDYGVGVETEEERRRREEEERRRAEGGFDLGAVANRYVQNRLGQAQQRVDSAVNLVTNPTDELQRRFGVTPDEAGTTEVQSQTVKTYADGSQEHVTKTQTPAPQAQTAPAAPGPVAPEPQMPAPQPQAAVPTAPTAPTAPAVPGQPDQAEIQRRADALRAMTTQGRPAPQAAPAPAAQVEPTAPVPPIGQVPTPGPGVQLAGPMVPGAVPPAPAPATTPTGEPQVAAPAPAPSLAQAGAQAQAAGQEINQSVLDARNETDAEKRKQKYAQILATDPSEATRNMVMRFIGEEYLKEQKVRKAVNDIESATENDLARYMREKKKEGSYVKAILYSRLGLTKLADREMELLEPSLTMTSMVDDKGQRYAVETDKNGNITRAFDPKGQAVGQAEVARLQASGGTLKGVEVEAGVFKDPTGQVAGSFVLERRPGGSVFREVGTNRIATPAESAILNKTGVQGTLSDQRARMIQEINLKLQGKTAEEKMAILRPYNQQLVANGYTAIDPSEVGISAPQIGGAPPAPPAGGGAVQQGGGAVQQGGGAVQQTAVPQGGGAVQQGGGRQTGGTGGVTGGGVAQGRQGRPTATQLELGKSGAQAAQAANIALGQEERSNFLTYEEKDIVPKADAGGSIAQIRRSQLKGPDGILNNPEIVGMMSGQGSSATEVGNIIRDLITGARTDEELSQRVASLGLTQRQKDVLYNQIALNRQVAPFTLKQNAGAGSVSDAEQKANRQANVDITRVPLYSAVTMLSRDQFDKDMAVARQAFRNANPNLSTVRAFNDAWGKEKSRLEKEYNQIYEERAKYIAKYYNNGANAGAVVDAYRHFPVPEYDRQTNSWNYGTDFARRAARPRLDSFVR